MITVDETYFRVEPKDISGRFVFKPSSMPIVLQLSASGEFVPGDFITVVNSGENIIFVEPKWDDNPRDIVYSTFANDLTLPAGSVTKILYRGIYNSASPFGGAPIPSATDGHATWEVEYQHGASALSQLQDVTLYSPPEANQVLMFDGSSWTPQYLPTVGDGTHKPRPYVVYTLDSQRGATLSLGSSADHNTYVRLTGTGSRNISVLSEADIEADDENIETWVENDYDPQYPGPMPIGGVVRIFNNVPDNTGDIVTLTHSPAVTINALNGGTVLRYRGTLTLTKVDNDEWDASGDLYVPI